MLPENKPKKTILDSIDDVMVTGHSKFISMFEKAGIDREFVAKPLYALSTLGFMIPGIALHESLLLLGLFPSGRLFYSIRPPDKLGNLATYGVGLLSLIGGEIVMDQSIQQNMTPLITYGVSILGMGSGAIGLATADYMRRAPQPKFD